MLFRRPFHESLEGTLARQHSISCNLACPQSATDGLDLQMFSTDRCEEHERQQGIVTTAGRGLIGCWGHLDATKCQNLGMKHSQLRGREAVGWGSWGHARRLHKHQPYHVVMVLLKPVQGRFGDSASPVLEADGAGINTLSRCYPKLSVLLMATAGMPHMRSWS